MKHNNNSDSKIEGINQMLDDMATDITQIIHNKDYTRLYLHLDDEIRNKGKLTLVSPPYIKQFSELLKIARQILKEINEDSGNMSPIQANVIDIMKKE